MRNTDLRPAHLAHLKGQGLIHIELEATRDREDRLVYQLQPKGGIFLCPTKVVRAELELLSAETLTFMGYGQSELGRYALTAAVYLADRQHFPRVRLQVTRLHEVTVATEQQRKVS